MPLGQGCGGGEVRQLNLTGTIKYDNNGRYYLDYVDKDGNFTKGLTTSGEPFQLNSGRVEAVEDFNGTWVTPLTRDFIGVPTATPKSAKTKNLVFLKRPWASRVAFHGD